MNCCFVFEHSKRPGPGKTEEVSGEGKSKAGSAKSKKQAKKGPGKGEMKEDERPITSDCLVKVYATRDIAAGDELVSTYGDSFWKTPSVALQVAL